MASKYPFKNLIFKGGGVKAFAYLGVLQVLEEYRILTQIERIAGASAGALMATLLSFRLSAQETIDLFKTMDYSKIAQTGEDEDEWLDHLPKLLERELEKLKGRIEVISRFFRRYGLYANDYVHGWLQEAIADHCRGNGNATFAEFRKCGFRDIYIVATNVSAHSAAIFSAETTPKVAVADAVLMSCSLPFYFEAPRFNGEKLGVGDIYTDGGVLSNYPLHIFDDPRYSKGNRRFDRGVNWETLGCRLFTPQGCSSKVGRISNLIDYIENLLETMAEVQAIAFESRYVDQFRTINISNCCIATTDFRIWPGENDPKYVALFNSGVMATREYLENYELASNKSEHIKKSLSGLLKWWQ
jgi:NTE family protein